MNNTSQFMDKEIMDLSSTPPTNDFIDLGFLNPQEDKIGGGKEEEILPNYNFQPIRPLNLPQQPSNLDSNNGGGSRAWNSADSRTNSANIRNYSSLDSNGTAKVIIEKDRNAFDAAIILEIDRAIKKDADYLLHTLEGVSARLSQLESRTRHLENSVDDLKISIGNSQGSTDGKMRQLENILREVQTGVENIRDKQEIVEGQMQLVKLRVSKAEQKPETVNTVYVDLVQQPASAPHQQSNQQVSPSVALPQSHPGLSRPNASLPPLTQQNFLSPVQLPNQFPQNQITSMTQQEAYFQTPAQAHEAPNQQYPLPTTHQPQPPPPAPPHQPYQSATQPQYSQVTQPPQRHPSLAAVNASQPQAPLGHHEPQTFPQASQYSQTYPPSLHQPSSHPPTGVPPQQFYGPPSHTYEPPCGASSGYSSVYGPSSSPSEPYSFSGPPSQYGSGTTAKPAQYSSAAMAQSGGGSYTKLPTARVLPHALPTASEVGGGSGSTGTGNKDLVDDVVDKVVSMGFPRDHVRATVWKLTDNGQAADLNVVLDKLMNDGEVQPQKGWFGR